jgi:tetratricopeptide (TPR) repeat protein
VFEQTNGRSQDAVAQYERALGAAQDSTSRAVAFSDLATAYLQTGDFARARTNYANALQQNPDSVPALEGSGLLAERDGDFTLAVARISHAAEVEPSDVGYLLLEQVLRRAGRGAEADDADARAQRMSRDIAQARQSAAQIAAAVGIRSGGQ